MQFIYFLITGTKNYNDVHTYLNHEAWQNYACLVFKIINQILHVFRGTTD